MAAIRRLRDILNRLKFVEVCVHGELNTLAACDNPRAMCTFNHNGYTWPLPQSCLVALEHILYEPKTGTDTSKGVFTVCASYRADSDGDGGRLALRPKVEVAAFGEYSDMRDTAVTLLQELGFLGKYRFVNYIQHARGNAWDPNVVSDILKPETVTFIEDIPHYRWDANHVSKVYCGHTELITVAEHTVESDKLLRAFLTFDEGRLSNHLYAQFGKERVDNDLFEFMRARSRSAGCSGSMSIVLSPLLDRVGL